jgi:competence protein ComEC
MTPFYSWISIPPISIFLYPATAGARILSGDFPDILVTAWSLWMRILVESADRLPAFARISEGSWIPALLLVIVQEWIPSRRRIWILPGLLILARLLWIPPHSARMVLWDVGQGDAAVFVKGDRAELVDAGPSFRGDPSQWIRRLARAGVGSLQGVLLTHLDADHRGGLDWIAPVVRIACVEVHDVGQAIEKLPASLHALLRQAACVRNLEIGWFRSNRQGGNQWMAGLVFQLSKDRAYFALGDGDRMQERLYAEWISGKTKPFTTRIWKAGHHGSRYSSEPLLISNLKPTEIWVSVGARNGYGHPSAEALERLVKGGARVHRTDVEGDLAVSSRE